MTWFDESKRFNQQRYLLHKSQTLHELGIFRLHCFRLVWDSAICHIHLIPNWPSGTLQSQISNQLIPKTSQNHPQRPRDASHNFPASFSVQRPRSATAFRLRRQTSRLRTPHWPRSVCVWHKWRLEVAVLTALVSLIVAAPAYLAIFEWRAGSPAPSRRLSWAEPGIRRRDETNRQVRLLWPQRATRSFPSALSAWTARWSTARARSTGRARGPRITSSSSTRSWWRGRWSCTGTMGCPPIRRIPRSPPGTPGRTSPGSGRGWRRSTYPYLGLYRARFVCYEMGNLFTYRGSHITYKVHS